MQFTTPIPIQKSTYQIDYNSKIVSLGSCFAVNIGEKFEHFKFQNTINPFGILFHPLALEKIISKAISKEKFTQENIFFHNERWHSFDVHSDLSTSNKEDFLEILNTNLEQLHNSLSNCSHVIITLGTSWVYKKIETDNIVANCHKVLQKEFKKELLSVEEIKKSLEEIVNSISKLNSEAKIVFTISPVRHIKDGFVENQWSKANLIAAVHETLHSKLSIANYFPSYEIMMDELRDYRFYAEDMIHPSQTAIDYIWKRFSETWISEEALTTLQEIENIQKGLNHRPFNSESEQHQKFLGNLQQRIEMLKSRFPFMNF
ncbi:GSCFA domain-containing protein [uncultured Flavobacterium sp.]|uniref:GSCFA domain-containing protein n=1 Tax=uncultured Flavobacterium sp. TaxID=165435 RepID=UPI0025D75AE2|nr:GSCFA domain-containing protein [uncultured Flavobacterium sp.]